MCLVVSNAFPQTTTPYNDFFKTKNRRLVSKNDFFYLLAVIFILVYFVFLTSTLKQGQGQGRGGPPDPSGVFNSLILTMIEHSDLRNDIREGFVQFSFCSNFIIKMYLGIDKSSKELSAEPRGETE